MKAYIKEVVIVIITSKPGNDVNGEMKFRNVIPVANPSSLSLSHEPSSNRTTSVLDGFDRGI